MSRPLAVSLAIVAAILVGGAWLLGVFEAPAPAPVADDAPAAGARTDDAPPPSAPRAPDAPRAPQPDDRADAGVPEIRTPLPPPPATGTLTVASDVPGADVFIDNAFVGKAPAVVESVAPGRRKISVSAPGHETVTEFHDVAPGPASLRIALKTIRLDRRVAVTHRHRLGSCDGTLVATPEGLRYTTDRRQDAFSIALSGIDTLEADYLDRSLKVGFDGRTFNFTVPQERVDRLYELYQDVEKARAQLRDGGV